MPYRDGKAAVVDLMRRSPDAPSGTMELLFAETLEDFHGRGREEASLGGVALASTGEREGRLERSLGWVFEHGGRVYDAKGLLAFKQKFAPAWRPQYLLYPTAFDLPRIVVAVARAFREKTPAPAEGRELEDVPVTAEDEAAAVPSSA
jgi:phosphatidylglycerol lysyltransferase